MISVAEIIAFFFAPLTCPSIQFACLTFKGKRLEFRYEILRSPLLLILLTILYLFAELLYFLTRLVGTLVQREIVFDMG